jgi:hypothetical protein
MLQNLAEALQAIVDNTNDHDMSVSSRQLGISDSVVKQLFSLGYIDSDMSYNVLIKAPGRIALEAHKQECKQQQAQEQQRLADKAERISDRKQQFRHDYRISLFSALIGAVIVLIIEHFQEILAFLRKVFFHQ